MQSNESESAWGFCIYIYIFFKEFLNHISPPPKKKNCLFFPYLTSNIIYFLFITFSFFFYWFEQLLQGVMSHKNNIWLGLSKSLWHDPWDMRLWCIMYNISYFLFFFKIFTNTGKIDRQNYNNIELSSSFIFGWLLIRW